MAVAYRGEVAIERLDLLEGEKVSEGSQVLLQPLATVARVQAAAWICKGWIRLPELNPHIFSAKPSTGLLEPVQPRPLEEATPPLIRSGL